MRLLRSAALLLGSALGFTTSVLTAAPAPVNPHATPEARALLAYIDSISGKGIVTGQHNFPNDLSKWSDRVLDLTGKYPGLFGEDFGFSGGEDKDSVLSRPATTREVERQWANGAIIALTWHAVRPTDDEPVTFHDSVQGHLTDYEWHQLLTPGTPLYNRWCEQVDVIAGYLRVLRDAHVPVLFRPYHEVNGNWFWWGYRPGPDGSAALYRQLYHRFTDVHHLDNLVWVWNVNAPGGAAGPVEDYFPGREYADVVTMDIYGEFQQAYYDSMLKLAGGTGANAKPIALAEVGAVPSPEVLAAQPRWAYFMVWAGLIDSSPAERFEAVYHLPQAINRDDPRQAAPLAAAREATEQATGGKRTPEPVTPNASKEARALLTQLAAAPGTAVLSGLQTAAAGGSNEAAGSGASRPAIVAAEFDPAAAGGLAEQAKGAHQAVELSWRPARPTDNGPAKSQLTDYEWNDLLTPGTDLNKRWLEQVDTAAKGLRAYADAGVPVLLTPLPEAGGKDFWWAGRKGVHGSAALYRMVYDRLTQQDGLRNLLFVWEIGPPAFGAGLAAMPADFFPGLLYVDALELRTGQLNGRFPMDRFLTSIGVDKPVGVELTGDVPSSDALTGRAAWSWFVVGGADAPQRKAALDKLLADPHVASAR